MKKMVKTIHLYDAKVFNNSRILVYHKNENSYCPDGSTSGAIAYLRFDPKYIMEGTYSNNDYLMSHIGTGNMIYFVDYCPTENDLRKLLENNNVFVIDNDEKNYPVLSVVRSPLLGISFKKNVSSSYLTWKHFYPEHPLPAFVKYIECGILQKFDLPESEKVFAGLCTLMDYSYGRDKVLHNIIHHMRFHTEDTLIERFLPIGEKALSKNS